MRRCRLSRRHQSPKARTQAMDSIVSPVPRGFAREGNPSMPRARMQRINVDRVTSILRDDARTLLYLANSNGIWIVSHQQVLRRHFCEFVRCHLVGHSN